MAMRFRFLGGGGGGEEGEEEGEEVVGMGEEELVCFVSLEGWRETALGMGLLVRPRTARER